MRSSFPSAFLLGLYLLSGHEAFAINTRAQRYSVEPSAGSNSGANDSSSPAATKNAPARSTDADRPGATKTPPLAPKQYDLTLPDGRKLRLRGVDVMLVAADGTETVAPDATYVATDGKVIPTEGGKIQGLR